MNKKIIDWNYFPWEKEIIPRLKYYTDQYMKSTSYVTGYDRGLIKGYEQEDLIYDAIRKTIEGTREWTRWNPNECDEVNNKNLFWHLVLVIKSDIYHQLNSTEKRRVHSVYDFSDVEGGKVIEFPDTRDIEKEVDQEYVLKSFLNSLKAVDPDLAELANLILVVGIRSTNELARVMDVAPSDILNMKKRLRRRMNNEIKELNVADNKK